MTHSKVKIVSLTKRSRKWHPSKEKKRDVQLRAVFERACKTRKWWLRADNVQDMQLERWVSSTWITSGSSEDVFVPDAAWLTLLCFNFRPITGAKLWIQGIPLRVHQAFPSNPGPADNIFNSSDQCLEVSTKAISAGQMMFDYYFSGSNRAKSFIQHPTKRPKTRAAIGTSCLYHNNIHMERQPRMRTSSLRPSKSKSVVPRCAHFNSASRAAFRGNVMTLTSTFFPHQMLRHFFSLPLRRMMTLERI